MNPLLRIGAYTLSVLSHPLLMLTYGLLLLLLLDPYLFPYSGGKEMGLIFLVVFFSGLVIPGIAILLMLGIGIIDSIQLPDKTDRIGPLMVTSIAYLWLYLNIRTHNAIPISYSVFVFGALISLFIAFFINNFSKISLHAVGLGGLFFFYLRTMASDGIQFMHIPIGDQHLTVHCILFLCILLTIIGMSLSSRIYLKAHTNQDILGGTLVGIIGQVLALLIG